jgi:hypothetical protein
MLHLEETTSRRVERRHIGSWLTIRFWRGDWRKQGVSPYPYPNPANQSLISQPGQLYRNPPLPSWYREYYLGRFKIARQGPWISIPPTSSAPPSSLGNHDIDVVGTSVVEFPLLAWNLDLHLCKTSANPSIYLTTWTSGRLMTLKQLPT